MTGLADRVAPVLLFLIFATVLAGVVGAAGVFESAAVRAARLARGRPWRLFALVVALSTVTTALLSLDTTVVLVTPVALALARQLNLSPWPYAFSTVWLAGTASLLLPVSNLTNLLAAGRISDSVISYTRETAAVEVCAVLVTVLVLAVLSRRELRGRYALPQVAPPPDQVLFRAAIAAIAGFAVLLVAGLPAYVCAAATSVPLAGLAVVRRSGVRPLALVPWRLVVAVLGLFASVSALGPHGLDTALRALAGSGDGTAGGLRVSATAALAGNAVDNLPAYLALERVVSREHTVSLLVGVDAGTLLTPWGSLATLLWASAVRRDGLTVPWRAFVLRGLLLVPLVLLACWGVLAATGRG